MNMRCRFGCALATLACLIGGCSGGSGGSGGRETVEVTDYKPPQAKPDDLLADDRLEDKKNVFNPELIDRRPLGEWLVNSSAAVTRLDVPIVRPDAEPHLLTLFPSYTAAIAATEGKVHTPDGVLPSVNMIDGKAKQFDDGLYAAIDQAYYRGLDERLESHVGLVRRIYEKLGGAGPAAAFLAAGLKLIGQDVPVSDDSARDAWIQRFLRNPVASKPIGFYTWTKALEDCWRFMRFFQTELTGRQLAIANEIAAALRDDSELLNDYRQVSDFYARLTNPYTCFSVADVLDVSPLTDERLKEIGEPLGMDRPAVALFPPSTSRETVLFEKLFADGIPPGADLMRELVRRIRSGEVDLAPSDTSGWYEYQVYALETLLLPERGEESDKLLLTKAYKERMLEAFKALMVKRRETHARQLKTAEAPAAAVPIEKPVTVQPRLRLEPAPSYYLRTARAYAFLENLLESTFDPTVLRDIHGLRKDGERADPLASELKQMRQLFYGLYLVSAEDIGMKTALKEGELESESECYERAVDWLATIKQDSDLAVDTRVSIPIAVDTVRQVTRLWITLGVRMTKLHASYAAPPQIKLPDGEWEEVKSDSLSTARYLIAVDEFAEIELPGMVSLTREELRKICDEAKTKEAILEALRRQ